MNRDYFLQTERIGFSKWTDADLPLAHQLWGDPDVTRLICASGRFTPQEIADRLVRELSLIHILRDLVKAGGSRITTS